MKKLLILSLPFLLLSSNVAVSQQLQFTPQNGWKGAALLTQNDDISSISDSGYGDVATRGRYDGLGMYQTGANSLSVWINHETTPGAISRVEMDRAKLIQAIQSTIDNGTTDFPSDIKTGIGYAYDSIYDNMYHALSNSNPVATGTAGVANYSDANFVRFCSGTSYLTNSFGEGRGFVDNIYITGEETSGGKFYALDEANNDLWEVDAFGTNPWENAALVDTGNSSHVALLLNSDQTGDGTYIRMYVGEKNVDANSDGSVDFLERNGLRGGLIYYFEPDSGSITDLPDGSVNGEWSLSPANALREKKLEDIHTNPLNGNQAMFSAQQDGVYMLEQQLAFTGSGLDTANSSIAITQIDDVDVGPLNSPDNLTWSADGMIYVQEDGGGDDMFQMNSDGTGLIQIASAFSEPSGIIDISHFVGYEAGSVFLSSLQGGSGDPAQLALLVSPTAFSSVPEVNSFVMLAVAGIGMMGRRRRTPKLDRRS